MFTDAETRRLEELLGEMRTTPELKTQLCTKALRLQIAIVEAAVRGNGFALYVVEDEAGDTLTRLAGWFEAWQGGAELPPTRDPKKK